MTARPPYCGRRRRDRMYNQGAGTVQRRPVMVSSDRNAIFRPVLAPRRDVTQFAAIHPDVIARRTNQKQIGRRCRKELHPY